MQDPNRAPPAAGVAALNTPTPADRRNFMTATTAIAVGGAIGAVPLLSGLYTFMDPLSRTSDASQQLPIRVASLDAVPADGIPRPFPVIADRRDAWNVYPQEVIGTVYLRRTAGSDAVLALHATCPHLGCFVNFVAERGEYQCPCHTSKFDVEGERILPCVSPRPMDELLCETKDGQVRVAFQNFRSGLDTKEPKA